MIPPITVIPFLVMVVFSFTRGVIFFILILILIYIFIFIQVLILVRIVTIAIIPVNVPTLESVNVIAVRMGPRIRIRMRV